MEIETTQSRQFSRPVGVHVQARLVFRKTVSQSQMRLIGNILWLWCRFGPSSFDLLMKERQR